ncbi:MAG: hypothetical protein JEZ05_01320 [Tenericutes bacterium]|nr:hypothetical protein [Mycoplasmatota bacterium]
MTLDLILKVLLTAMLGYVALNTFFKFHFSMDIHIAILLVIVGIVSILFLDTENFFAVGLTWGIVLFIFVVLKLISIKRKRHGYFFFNVYSKQYPQALEEMIKLADELNIARKNISYNQRYPFLVVIKEVELKTADKFIKKLDYIYIHKPKKLTMYHYWTIIIFFTLMAALWRFL